MHQWIFYNNITFGVLFILFNIPLYDTNALIITGYMLKFYCDDKDIMTVKYLSLTNENFYNKT